MTTAGIYPRGRGDRLGEAARSTGMLLRLRWRTLRSVRSKMAVAAGLGFLFVVLFAASEAGTVLRALAEQGNGSSASKYAASYIVALRNGDLGSIGAIALGTAFAAALFNPFTGAANVALASADSLTALRPHRLHRHFDALLTQAVSTVGFLQLVSLTCAASLVTLDGGRPAGLVLTWAVWPVLLLASVTEGWVIEYMQRRFGTRIRVSIGSGCAVLIAGVLWVDPHHGETLFGIGDVYSWALSAAAAGSVGVTVSAIAVLASSAVLLFAAGLRVCAVALSLPAPATKQERARRIRVPISRRPWLSTAQVLGSQLTRTVESRRPLVTIVMLAVPAAWLSGATSSALTTMVIAIPLAVSLAWGVNAFGVIGPGMTWLMAQPRFARRALTLVVTLQLSVICAISVLCFLPPAMYGALPGRKVAAVAAGLAVSGALTTRNAVSKAVRRPFLARLGARGDVIVPPLTAVNYTVRFVIFGGQLGVIVMTQAKPMWQLVMVTVVLAWALLRYAFLARQWRNRTVQAQVVAAVAAA